MFACFGCTLSFQSSDLLVAHISLFHSENVRSGNLKCVQSKCNRLFDRMRSFSRHVKSHKEQTDQRFPLPSGLNNPQASVSSAECTSVSDSCIENSVDLQNLVQNDNLLCEPAVFETSLANAAFGFLGKLYSIDTLPRGHVQLIVDSVIELLNGPHMKIIESRTLNALQSLPENEGSELQNLFICFSKMFDGLETEHKRIKAFKESGAYIEPMFYTVGSALDAKHLRVGMCMEPVDLYGQFVPMRKTLRAFLELPGVLNGITSYIDKLESKDSSFLENFVQGSLWKDIIKPQFPDKFVLPLCMYYDDYEPGDSAGPHAGTHKMGGTYFTMPCIPPEFRSSSDNVFLAAIFYAQDKYFGNEEIFRPALNELEFLENFGIPVVVENTEQQVFFALSLFLGDNLAVHQVNGFCESFSANYFCRRCKAHKKVTQTQTKADPDLFRTQENYEFDLSLQDVSLTGLKSRCIWNRFKGYHCIQNICYDIMHDLEEGAWEYDICLLILALIRKKRFTINELNNRIQGFDFGFCEAGNKPGLISDDNLKKGKLKFTAAEKLCFVRYFGLLVGDLIADTDEKLWRFYEVIHEIIVFLASPIVVAEDIDIFSALVSEHHCLYLELFPGETLKPKHHNMLHYPEIIRKVGPLPHVSCWGFERKHRPFQRVAKTNCNYRNLPLTLAVKHQLKFCQRLLSGKGFSNRIISSSAQAQPTNSLKEYGHFYYLLPSKFREEVFALSWVEISGTMYNLGLVVCVKLGEEHPVFAKIKFIFLDDNSNKVTFVTKGFHTEHYSSKFQAYKVALDEEWFVLEHSNLVSFVPTVERIGPDGYKYVTFRHKL